MLQEDILKLLSGTSTAAKNSSNMLKNKIAEIVEEKVLKGKYVSREEHNKLKQLVEKLEKQVSEIKSTKK